MLGDYVYERVHQWNGRPDGRAVVYEDMGGCRGSLPRPQAAGDREGVEVHEGGDDVFAYSLDNYRQMYRFARSDPLLQRVHERVPMVSVADDHEFVDNAWEDAHYFCPLRKMVVQDRERYAASRRAYSEFMLWRLGDPAYSSFAMGKRLQLLITDFRTYKDRPPLLDDDFPGKIIVSAPQLAAARDQSSSATAAAAAAADVIAGAAEPYVDLSPANETLAPLRAAVATGLAEAYKAKGRDSEHIASKVEEDLSGDVALSVVEQLCCAGSNGSGDDARGKLLSELVAKVDELPKGLATRALGKASTTSAMGAVFMVRKDLWEAYQALQPRKPENPVLGGTQEAWLQTEMASATQRGVGRRLFMTTTMVSSLLVNGSKDAVPALGGLPADKQHMMYLNLDCWDGYPSAKRDLMDMFKGHSGTLVVSGDVHGAFVHDLGSDDGSDGGDGKSASGLHEVTVCPMSSKPLGRLLLDRHNGLAMMREPWSLDEASVGRVLHDSNPTQMRWSELFSHGAAVITAAADRALHVEYALFPAQLVHESHYGDTSLGENGLERIHQYLASGTRKCFVV